MDSKKTIHIPAWQSLPVGVHFNDIITIHITSKEEAEIEKYVDHCFSKSYIDNRPSQFLISKGKSKTNSNCIGIYGEYAGIKHLMKNPPSLSQFLRDRPSLIADRGDALINSMVFDYKTRSRLTDPRDLIRNDDYFAEMDAKFSNRKKYSYLEGFIFSTYNNEDNTVGLVGWLSANDFFGHAQVISAGELVPMGYPYRNDCMFVPYRRLRPISELKDLGYKPITQKMTLAPRSSGWTITP